MRPGLAEWLTAANPRSKIASVSGKDRGAIQPVSHAKGYVYWFDVTSGEFVTSTYYRNSNPAWITDFNNNHLKKDIADSVWRFQAPASFRRLTVPDTSASENDGIHTYFPHRFSAEGGATPNFWLWWDASPNLDRATLELAQTMVTSLDLGGDADPDYLNVSVSATDLVGHRYGPHSREQLDNLVRLDKELGAFFDFLDAKVGEGQWTVMLTADHGVLDTPEELTARGEYGHRLTAAELAKFDSLRAEADANPDKAAAALKLVSQLKKIPLVADAWTQQALEQSQPTDSFAVLQKRSLYEGREDGMFSRQGVEFRFIPGVLTLPRGSSHGQTYFYDRHVPMIFMGPGIAPGRDASRAATVDFAPTAATILGIPFPSDLDGKVLTAVAHH
jgi:predicted AlkP superfamily pyrophosphatase or phosphodiesterase